jgi:glutaconate CoA-transferase subunit A
VIGKQTDADSAVGLVESGMTIGIGGWGSRRKPMALVRALVRSGVRDLTVVSFGGPDVGILCATGQAAKVMHGFVTLDSIAIEPHFAARRQAGTVASVELDEGMLVSGLRAGARRLPFEVTRSGLGSDAVLRNPAIRTVISPYDDGEELVAMPGIRLDVALVHLDQADAYGSARCLGPDLYFDDLFALAADRTILSAESVVDTAELVAGDSAAGVVFNRTMVDCVVSAPGGAHFTSCAPGYPRDEPFQRAYAASAGSESAWAEFRSRFVEVDDDAYHRAVDEFREHTR